MEALKNVKKTTIYFTILLIMIVIGFICINSGEKISEENLKDISLNEKILTLSFDINSKDTIYCGISGHEDNDEDIKYLEIIDNKCEFEIDKGIYHLFLKNDKDVIYLGNTEGLYYIEDFGFNKDIIYLAIDGEEELNFNVTAYGDAKEINYEIENKSIATIIDNKVIGLNKGNTKIIATLNDQKDEIEVVVTDLIVKMPDLFDFKKGYLPCNQYDEEEAKLLDEILYSRVEEAGYQTRAGVCAAVRFLMFEFPYRINYYSENGRLSNGMKADGEGRYYHRGLYLSEDKFEIVDSDLNYSYGPCIWGCQLYSYLLGRTAMNGLDCSGFVTWCLINGGFDVGDVGAGPSAGILDLTDYGEYTRLTKEVARSDKIKAGDLIGYDGHIAIVAGVDEDYIYVAEALWEEIFGVTVTRYSRDTISNTLTHVMLMDSYYLDDGNYTAMWY